MGPTPGDEGAVRVGITDYAQDALGDIVFVSLPEAGAERSPAGSPAARSSRPRASATSTRRSAATVVARNEALDATPSWSTPTRTARAGWSRSRVDDAGAVDALLDAAPTTR